MDNPRAPTIKGDGWAQQEIGDLGGGGGWLGVNLPILVAVDGPRCVTFHNAWVPFCGATPAQILAEAETLLSFDRSLKAVAVIGGRNISTEKGEMGFRGGAHPTVDILIGTPGRMIDHLDNTGGCGVHTMGWVGCGAHHGVGGVDILIGTPGRMIDHRGNTGGWGALHVLATSARDVGPSLPQCRHVV